MNLINNSLLSYYVRRGRRSTWTPAALFAQGQQGVWYEPKPQYLFQDAAGTEPITADGDPVGLMLDLSGNGNHATQSAGADRPIYRTDGVRHWLAFNGVNHLLGIDTALSHNQWSLAVIFSAVERDFILAHTSANLPWSGIGQQGSTHSVLVGQGSSQGGFYVDGDLSTATTRGGQFDFAVTGNVLETVFTATIWNGLRIGQYAAGGFSTAGPFLGQVVRSPAFDQDERNALVAYGKVLVGADS